MERDEWTERLAEVPHHAGVGGALVQQDFFGPPVVVGAADSAADSPSGPTRERALPELRVLSQSRMGCYLTCPRLYLYTFVEGYRPAQAAAPLRTGTLGHRGLEAWWRAGQRGATADERLDAALAAIADEPDPYELARMQVLLAGYTTRWASDVDELEVVDVEVEFTCPIVNPETGAASRTWVLGGKLDVVVRTRDGRLYIVEHKFSGEDTSPGSNYWRRLRVDKQVSAYYAGATALYGEAVWGCIYDVIAKPAVKPLKATALESRKYKKDGSLYASQRAADESPDEYAERLLALIETEPARYFVRGEVVRLEEDVRDAQFDVWQVARAIRDSEVLNRWPRNSDACARYGRACDFLPVCCREASLDDSHRYRRATAPNEELTGVAGGSPSKEEEVP